MYFLKEIADITNSKLIGENKEVKVFLTDSRAFVSADKLLFVALKSGKNDGHKYIPELINKGVKSFLIADPKFDMSRFDQHDVSFLVSEDPLDSLQKLAIHHRKKFAIPVIGITGSNGKTVVKEWLYQLLKHNYAICRSPKSFNSQLGVPLSVLNLDESHTLGIFEAGISESGEMQKLVNIIQPTLGIITSIGSAHDEGFKNRDEKINEKLRLVEYCDQIFINGIEKPSLPSYLHDRSLVIAENKSADLIFSFANEQLHLVGKDSNQNKIELILNPQCTDNASISNICTCVAVLLHLGYSPTDIAEKIKLLQPIALRLEIKNGINNSLIINDFYNSDLDSLKIALSFLSQQSRKEKKIVVVSDIEQSGVSDNQLYSEIAKLMSYHQIDHVVGIGRKISDYRNHFSMNSDFFGSTEEFLQKFTGIRSQFENSTTLLKGARSFGFESLSNLLQQKSHDTIFEINLNKLSTNLNYYKLLIEPHVKIMCMVKAMGYGGGGSELAKTLQHLGANYLAVAYADEGVELRQSQVTMPVLVMSPEVEAFEDIINYNLEPEIYSFRILELFLQKLDQLSIASPYPIHLKIDTGMNRLGFEDRQIDGLIKVISQNKQVKVQSVFSHLATADNFELDDFTEKQIELFNKVCQKIEAGICYSFLKHICNSAATTRFKHAHFDMVRLGIGLHGIGVHPAEQRHLQNVGTLKTRISQIKKVQAGNAIGYNRSGKAEKDLVIATIPIGYADGFSRMLGNGKFGVHIGKHYCKTIGNICMDMCMVDVSGISCQEGDEVVVFGNTEQLQQMAMAMGTISYEVLTSVSGRVKRIYVQE